MSALAQVAYKTLILSSLKVLPFAVDNGKLIVKIRQKQGLYEIHNFSQNLQILIEIHCISVKTIGFYVDIPDISRYN